MRVVLRVGALLATALAVSAVSGAAQGGGAGRDAYFGAVAEYFQLPSAEVAILGEWRLPEEEIPVVLFVARRAGVSPEALVALRRSGQGWAGLARRYGLAADQFHVPLPDAAPAGVLAEAYQRFRSLPAARWGEVALGDGDIVALVNLKLLSSTLGRTPEEILARVGQGVSWMAVYAGYIGDVAPF